MSFSVLFCGILVGITQFIQVQSSFFESFGEGWDKRWIHSSDPKYSGRFELYTSPDVEDQGLQVPVKANHYGLSTKIDPVDPSTGLVLQYEVKVTDGMTCGGAYLKFVTEQAGYSGGDLKDDTPYTVMFGPDKCGSTNKVHLIIRHKSPLTGKVEEKHLKVPPAVVMDDKTHVYTAILKPDNTYAVLVDGKEKKAGSLFEDFEPPFVPPQEIPDPDDEKPADWVDVAKIPDPSATKPEYWDEDAPIMIEDEDAVKPSGWLDDEPTEIDDPSAKKPEDWDDEEDGEWEPPKVPNPKCKVGCGEWKRPQKKNPAYKGKWSAPLIDNPEYKGAWKPRDIPNPDYYDDKEPLAHIGEVGAVAIEIWTMDKGYVFDNVLVSNKPEEAAEKRDALWAPKYAKETEAAKKKGTDAEGTPVVDPVVKFVEEQINSIPFLAAYKDTLQPALDLVKDKPFILYAALGVPLMFVFLMLLRLLTGGKKVKAPSVGEAKKADITSPDDDEPTPTANGSSSQVDEDKKASGSGAKGSVLSNGGTASGSVESFPCEIEEEEKEEETVRRRPRRDT